MKKKKYMIFCDCQNGAAVIIIDTGSLLITEMDGKSISWRGCTEPASIAFF